MYVSRLATFRSRRHTWFSCFSHCFGPNGLVEQYSSPHHRQVFDVCPREQRLGLTATLLALRARRFFSRSWHQRRASGVPRPPGLRSAAEARLALPLHPLQLMLPRLSDKPAHPRLSVPRPGCFHPHLALGATDVGTGHCWRPGQRMVT